MRQISYGMRALFNRSAVDASISEEVAHFVDELTESYRARGFGVEEARRAALMEIGGEQQMRENVRSYGWENFIETAASDIRFSMRRLAYAPGFTVAALLTLALGIGGTTAIFSAVNPILFRSLPYAHAERIVMIWDQGQDGSRGDGTYVMYRRMQERARSFESMAAYKAWLPTVTGAEHAERFDGQRVTYDFFRVLGVSPASGRSFTDADDRARGPLVVVLSDALWRRRYGADPGIIGRQIRLNESDYTVIGVMPANFRNVLAPGSEIWAPLQYDVSEDRAWGHHLRTIGRLRRGVTAATAQAELNKIGTSVLAAEKPITYGDNVRWVAPQLQSDLTRSIRPALLAVLTAMALVLGIACVNVTNLLLARGVQRRGEFALRAALGAGRGRMIRQLLTESMLLSALAGLLGMGVASLGVRVLTRLAPPTLPSGAGNVIHLDRYAFLFGALVTTVIGVAFGLLPALQSSGNEHRDLQNGAKRVAGARHTRMRTALVVAEIALALVLLVGSGLLLRSMQRLLAIPPGFNADNVVTVQIQATGQRYATDENAYRFFADALKAVRNVPGVQSAALTTQLPMSGDFDSYGVHFETGAQLTNKDNHSSFRYAVTPDYLTTMGIALRSGRGLTEADHAGTPLAALINESFAKRNFPDTDPIGQRLRIGSSENPPFTVVGVVADVKQMSLTLNDNNAVYTTIDQSQFGDRVASLVVRSQRDPAALVPAIREAVWSVDKDQPVTRVATMSSLLAASSAERRFALVLFEAFAIAALALAAAGIYSVVAGSVAERTREIGVRSALGAQPLSIIALIMGQGFRLTVFGIGAGVLIAVTSRRALESMLFGVSPIDTVTYAGVILLLASVSLVACAVPAWRAARVDAVNTLRVE